MADEPRELDHWVCCRTDDLPEHFAKIALCGRDVSEQQRSPDGTPASCPTCKALEGSPCVEVCPFRSSIRATA